MKGLGGPIDDIISWITNYKTQCYYYSITFRETNSIFSFILRGYFIKFQDESVSFVDPTEFLEFINKIRPQNIEFMILFGLRFLVNIGALYF